MSKKIIVIGGGAAGMLAAISAAERGASVTLLEPNERLGKKLNITGKGRCNLTNDADTETVLAHIPRNGRFLYSALSRFGPRDVMAFFEGLGVPLKVERGNRVFPVSDRAFDVSGALERRLRKLGVRWVQDRAVSIETDNASDSDAVRPDVVRPSDNTVRPAVTAVRGKRDTYPADAVILATGGVSYPATGSTGEGHRMARSLGHTVTPLRGSLVPLCEAGNLCARMQGLSLRNVRLTVWEGKAGKRRAADNGKAVGLAVGGKAADRTGGEKAADLTDSGKAADQTDGGKAADQTDGGKAADQTDSGKAADQTDGGKAASTTDGKGAPTGTEKPSKEKRIFQGFGELLFTHFGVSGPLVLSASAHMRRFDDRTCRLEIDLKPALDEPALDRRLLSDLQKYANHDFANTLDDLLPRKMIPVVVELSGIPAERKARDVTREERRRLLNLLKRFPVSVAGPRPVTEAIVTSGGVSVKEVEPASMESKRVKGLYFAGEILDVDAYTGGFNLQIAWCTGRAAGFAAAERSDTLTSPTGEDAMKHFNVAIDGPSGAGKSTLARRAAEDFNLLYVDTGAIYRTVGLYALETRTDPRNAEDVAALLPGLEIGLSYNDDGLQVMRLNGKDVTNTIRRPEVSLAASSVSAHAAVRAFLIQTQRGLARDYSVVMDGRDIGTVVLPNAALKVFLTASVEERARRRTLELEQRGTPRPYENVLQEMEQRDYEDIHRAIAPLRQAEDAVLLDTSDMNFQESLDALERLIRERMGL